MTPEQFVAQWQDASGSERANYQSFFNDLCELLEVERPRPAQADDRDNAYVHERHLKSADGVARVPTAISTPTSAAASLPKAKPFMMLRPAPTHIPKSTRRGTRPRATPATCPKASPCRPC